MKIDGETNVLTTVYFEFRGFILDQSKEKVVCRWYFDTAGQIFDELWERAVEGKDKVAVEFVEKVERQDALSDEQLDELC